MAAHKHRRSWIVPALFIACLVIAVSYAVVAERAKQERTQERAKKTAAMVLLINKMDYVRDMGLCYQGAEGEYPGIAIFSSSAYQSHNYKDCVFVSSKDKAKGYGSDVIVAWPTEDTEHILSNIDDFVKSEKIDLGKYDLTYPITINDVIKKYNDLRNLRKDIGDKYPTMVGEIYGP